MHHPGLMLPLEEHVLANGLRVVVSPDHTTPIAAVNVWYHVGSANERAGRTGFAHLFEHMLFQGSAQVAANEHFEIVQRAGGTANGSTWIERTNYYETLPSHHLATALWLEAERMGNLLPAMTQAKLDTQREVVKNERRWSVDNQPYGTWWERLPALCFPSAHPFHHSLIGSMEDLSAATLGDVTEFFGTWYVPDNAVLSIVGDVDVGEVKQLAERFFGEIPRGAVERKLPDFRVSPTLGGWVRETVEDDVMVPRVFLTFRVPPFGSEGHVAATATAAVLGSGKESRLYSELVREKEVASSASAYLFDLARGSDLLIVDVTARPHVGVDALEDAVAGVVRAILEQGCTHAERDRAVRLTATEFVGTLQSAQSRADRISQYATYLGDAQLLNTELGRMEQVSAGHVTDFCRIWLGEENRASLRYVPRTSS